MYDEEQRYNEQYYFDWFDDHYTDLTIGFLESISPEDVPLDDDTGDYIDSHMDEFEGYCQKQYQNWLDNKD